MRGFAISRVTLFSFLLALMLGIAIQMWSSGMKDECAPYLAGDNSAPATEFVVTGSHRVEVSCNDWLFRMPLAVQMLCLLGLVLGAMFLMNGLGDVRDWLVRRRQ
jgi:hypothetical protein